MRDGHKYIKQKKKNCENAKRRVERKKKETKKERRQICLNEQQINFYHQ